MAVKAVGVSDNLVYIRACKEAILWSKQFDNNWELAWNQCERGDWLLWFCDRVGVDRRLVAFAACQCARTALIYVPPGEDRPRKCIEITEAWCRGEAAAKDVRRAAYADYTASRYAEYAASSAAEYPVARDPDAEPYVASYSAVLAADAAAARQVRRRRRHEKVHA